MSHLSKIIRSISYYSAILLTAFVFAACGNDDEPAESTDNTSSGKLDHSVKHKLLQMEYKYGNNGETQMPFSKLTYDNKNRLISYNALHSRVYYYEYNTDNIQITTGSTQSSATGIERKYNLKNGRIAGKCRYDSKNRLIAIENVGSERYDLEWTDGNITKITRTSETTGSITSTFKIHYTDIACESLMMCMGYPADTGSSVMSPYSFLYHIDPVLVEEGYYGDSMVKNLWDEIESSYTNTNGEVTYKFNWENMTNGLPCHVIQSWNPSGVSHHYITWAD